eukprot:966598-Pyramimonas_sp.AAC.1
MEEGQPVVSKLLPEQAMIKALAHLGGRLKPGAAPVGHLEMPAQKLPDRSRPKDPKGKARGGGG